MRCHSLQGLAVRHFLTTVILPPLAAIGSRTHCETSTSTSKSTSKSTSNVY